MKRNKLRLLGHFLFVIAAFAAATTVAYAAPGGGQARSIVVNLSR